MYGEVVQEIKERDYWPGLKAAQKARKAYQIDLYQDGVQDVAEGDISGMFDEHGQLLPMGMWDKKTMGLVKSVSFTPDGGVKSVSFHGPKLAALAKIGEATGQLGDKDQGKLTLLVAKRLEEMEK